MRFRPLTSLALLGAVFCGFHPDVVGPSGERLRPWQIEFTGHGGRIGSDKLPAEKGAFFEPGVYSAAEVVEIVNRDAIGVDARVLPDGRVEVSDAGAG